jgi:hypothetical protein
MSAIELCRTAALGGHVEACEDCAHARVAYNSCRNRHCPKCQSATRERWLADRQADLLPVPYFHVVFTVPAEVAAIAFHNKAVVYAILFDAVAATLKTIAADPRHLGGEIGFLAILHSWGQASPTTRISTVSYPAARSRTANAGSPAGRASSCPSMCFRACFAGCSSNVSRRRTRAVACASRARSPNSTTPMSLLRRCGGFVVRTGSSMPSRRSVHPSTFSPISDATRTGSPSPTVAWSAPTIAAWSSAGAIIAMAMRPGRCRSIRTSSSAASSSTASPTASTAFAITASSPTAVAGHGSPRSGSSCQ